MTRRFWAGVMVLALLVAAGSASFMWDRMNQAPSGDEPPAVPLRTVPPEEMPPLVETSSATAVPAEGLPAASPAPEATPADAHAAAKRNILFKLVRPTAKEVFIVGDFNDWTRKPMKKKGKTWETSVPLAPGKYEYAFVVDGKRVRDPNNKQSGSNGKSSVLTVKPLAKRS